jgi:hypothetical protein
VDEKFEYFIERTEKDFRALHQKIDHVVGRVDKLWGFYFMVLGGAGVIAALVTFGVNLALVYFEARK